MLHQPPQGKVLSTSNQSNISEKVAQLEQFLSELKAEMGFSPARLASEADLKKVRQLLKARRLREQMLGSELFADPAWDLLLEAYASSLEQRRLSVSSLCGALPVPATTALRWIKKLEEDGWLRRQADPLDGRRYWMQLTERGSERLERYFNAVGPDGPVI